MQADFGENIGVTNIGIKNIEIKSDIEVHGGWSHWDKICVPRHIVTLYFEIKLHWDKILH